MRILALKLRCEDDYAETPNFFLADLDAIREKMPSWTAAVKAAQGASSDAFAVAFSLFEVPVQIVLNDDENLFDIVGNFDAVELDADLGKRLPFECAGYRASTGDYAHANDDGDIKFDTSDDDTMTTVYTEYVDPFADFDVIKVRVTDDGHWESA